MPMRTPTRLALTITALLALLPTLQAGKLSLEYNLDRRVIRVCNLLVPGGYANRNPFLFMALERSPLKPAGWEFENPLAVPYVQDGPTPIDMWDQWEAAGHAPDAGSGPGYWTARGMAVGAPINKSWPQYWEVYFDGNTAQRLRDFDLIYICSDTINCGSTLRRALADAVEAGATLWVDNRRGATATDIVNFEPPRIVSLVSGNYRPFWFVNQAPAPNFCRRDALWNAERNSDLFRTPLTITDNEKYLLGNLPQSGSYCDGNYIEVPAGVMLDQQLVPILYTLDMATGNAYPTIAACQYGAGRIVVSANAIGEDVERWLIQGRSGPDADQAPDVKLAYNIVAWGSSWTGARQSSVNQGYSVASVLPPLDIAWQFPSPQADPAVTKIGPVVASPVVSHGRVFVVSLISDAPGGGGPTPAMLMCFDADPARDLDGDGNPDDAADLDGDGDPDPVFFDYRYGLSYDLVWARSLNDLSGGRLNSATPRWAGVTACNLPDGTFAVLCSFVSLTGTDSRSGFVAAVNGETGQLIWRFEAPPFDVNDADPSRRNADVRDISTPVAHRGWVYFVCSEYDPDLAVSAAGTPDPAWGADATYGRAWCIDLQTGGGSIPAPSWFTNYGLWSYPDADVDRDGQVAPADTDEAEIQGLLPPFAEPRWLAGLEPQEPGLAGRPRQLPPDPGAIPAITTHTRNAEDSYTEAVMLVGTPVSMAWDADNQQARIARQNLNAVFEQIGTTNERRGGEDLALVPTPGRVVGANLEWFLNRNYYRFWVPGVELNDPTDIQTIARHDDPTNVQRTSGWILGAPPPTRLVVLNPDTARYLLAKRPTPADSPLRFLGGAQLDLTRTAGPPPELCWTRGQQPWSVVYSRQERRVGPAAVRNEKLFATTTLPDPDPSNPGVTPGGGRTGRLVSQDLRVGAREWQFNPGTEAPAFLASDAPAFYAGRSEAAPGVAHDTIVTAMSLSGDTGSRSALFGTGITPLLTVSLSSAPGVATNWRIAPSVPNPVDANPDHRKPVTVRLFRDPAIEVDRSFFQVDYDQATITFHWETAWNVTGGGHIYGEPLLITWRNDRGTPTDTSDDTWEDNRLYVVPPLTRFAYVAPFIKLRHYPVDWATITITTFDDVPVRGFVPGEPLINYDRGGDGTPEQYLPRGWILLAEDDNGNGVLDAGEDRNGNGVLDAAFVDVNNDGAYTPGVDRLVDPGTMLRVSYVGFENEWGFFTVPYPMLNLPPEEHQAPIGFGPSASSVTVAGSAIHVGTEGYAPFDPDTDGRMEFSTPPGALSPNETLLSVLWNPTSNLLRGWLTAPAELGNFRNPALAPPNYQVPAATGSPALGAESLFIGSRIMDDASYGASLGFVSRLSTRRTMIVDASRVIECAGQDVQRELTGTQSWEYGQQNNDRPVQLPLNHPAKVASLGGGNLLIVDSGNNRVVQVDSSGNVLWPLGRSYNASPPDPPPPIVNWYSSPLNPDLHLLRPSDAQRLTSIYDINDDGVPEQVVHTLIADSGNDRVLHVRSWVEWDEDYGRWEQQHSVQTVTTEYVQDPMDPIRRVKGHYTHVAGIPHPDPTFSNPATADLVGYLCAAPNLREIVVMGYYQVAPGDPVQFGPNPPANAYLPGATGPGSPTWALWSWLYDDPTDAVIERNNPLLFAGLRHMELKRVRDVLYLDIACGQYQGRRSTLGGGPPYPDLVGPAALEFQVSYDPAAPGLIPASPGGTPDPNRPIWYFTQAEYNNWEYFRLPLPNGTTYFKRFLPTCVSLLPTGRRLIVNNSGLIERFTKAALGVTGVVCSSEVFEVETATGGDDDPTNDTYNVDPRRIVPDPFGPEWRDPLVAPVYAERVTG